MLPQKPLRWDFGVFFTALLVVLTIMATAPVKSEVAGDQIAGTILTSILARH
jgi:hypothetical protein